MFGVFDKFTGKQPKALRVPSVKRPRWYKTRKELGQFILNVRNDADTTFYNFPNGNFMALSQKDERPPQPRSIVVMDDVFCIFFGYFDNNPELRQYYGLSRIATEAMVVYTAYTVMRDRGPFPPDHVVRDFRGRYAFMLFDSKHSIVFLARDRQGAVELHWGTAADGSLVTCDDTRIVAAICGNCYTPFPHGCFFLSGFGLCCYDHPFHMVKPIEHRDEINKVRTLTFEVDLQSRTECLPRTGSGENWAFGSTSGAKDDDEQQ